MKEKFSENIYVKHKYLNFIKSQEYPKNPFKNKVGQLKRFYIPLCKIIFNDFKKNNCTRIIGLSGSQGSGKSTISKILSIILKEKYKLNTTTLSIDDFYKTFKDRKKMSKKISELFLTRGVPGTHDTKILIKCLNKLKHHKFKNILIPKFDKSNDDRFKKKNWTKIKKKPDIIIFEGWCVGAKAQPNNSLIKPINELERHLDKNLTWRKRINNELKGEYKKIFNLINLLIFLKVPSFKYVYKWRSLQEKKLKKLSKGKKIMNTSQIKKFIMFYERITRNMLKTLPFSSNILLTLDKKHCLKSMRIN